MTTFTLEQELEHLTRQKDVAADLANRHGAASSWVNLWATVTPARAYYEAHTSLATAKISFLNQHRDPAILRSHLETIGNLANNLEEGVNIKDAMRAAAQDGDVDKAVAYAYAEMAEAKSRLGAGKTLVESVGEITSLEMKLHSATRQQLFRVIPDDSSPNLAG